MKKQYISSITKNHKIEKKIFFDGVPLKGYIASSPFPKTSPSFYVSAVQVF